MKLAHVELAHVELAHVELAHVELGPCIAMRRHIREKERPALRRTRGESRADVLSLRELEASSSLGLAVFLALNNPRVARQKSALFQDRSQGWFVFDKRATNTVAHRTGLPGQNRPPSRCTKRRTACRDLPLQKVG